MKCGREPGGKKENELGACPATIEIRVDGIHDGKNAGRCCWAIAGTFCEGKIQGSFAKKFGDCIKCTFYIKVSEEEDSYRTATEVNKILKENT